MPRTPSHYARWTADSELAFIIALKLHGRTYPAAAEVGRTVAGAYHRRKRLPDFAARWDAAIEDWRRRMAANAAPPAPDADDLPIVERFDGFTKTRRRAFLRRLTETGDVEDACRYVRLSLYQAQHHRRRHPSFAAAWDKALAQSVATLEQVAIDRAVEGVEEEVWHAGKKVGTRRRYSDNLLKSLLDRRGKEDVALPGKNATKKERIEAAWAAAKLAGGSFVEKRVRSHEETNAAILTKLAAIRAHRRREEAARAEVWLREGRIP